MISSLHQRLVNRKCFRLLFEDNGTAPDAGYSIHEFTQDTTEKKMSALFF